MIERALSAALRRVHRQARRGRPARRFALLGVVLAGALGVASACSLSGLDDKYGLSLDGAPNESSADACGGSENCGNGIDDNCDGLVDCADPSCITQGFACTAGPIPAGWTLVAFSAATRPVCPPLYGAEQSIISNVAGAPVGCQCTCSGGPATCGGTATYYDYPNACSTGQTTVNLPVSNGACATTATSIPSSDYYQLYFDSVPVPKQGTCIGTGLVTTSPPPTFNAGATCASPGALGTGCSSGVCAPPAGVAFKSCISHPGSVACPTFGFTAQVLASTGSQGYVDKRGCGACPCGTNLGCGTVTNVAVFTNANCTGAATYNVNPTCQLAGSTANVASYRVSFPTTGDAGCKPTGASEPDGGVVLDDNVETICCPP